MINCLSMGSDRRIAVVGTIATACLLLGGCMSARVDESREQHTEIGKDEAVVILAKPQIESLGAEDKFMDCIGSSLSRGGERAIRVADNDTFVDSVFPWLEAGTAPTRPEAVATLLTRPGVAEQFERTGVRYIVWLDGGTRKTDGGGSLACGAAPGAAGCVGFGWWEKESAYEATIWDVKTAKSAGSVGTNVTGTSAIIGAVVPLPFIARVEGTACNRISEQLRGFFHGDDTAPAAPSGAGSE
ncbi:MAG: hypothetical protein R3E77_15455 [Steroidobacteraceae bacterium]